jgi:hypothetical protein
LKIHKDLINSLLQAKKEAEDKLSDQLLITEQLTKNLEREEAEIVFEFKNKIADLTDELDRKEFFLQAKEKKWSDLEKIVVEYARNDNRLRDKLDEIKYICDDPSSKRKISTVFYENEELKKHLSELQTQLDDVKSHVGQVEEDYFKIEPVYNGDNTKASTRNILLVKPPMHLSDRKLPIRRRSQARRLEEVLPINAFKGPLRLNGPEDMDSPVEDVSKSTNECSRCKKLKQEVLKVQTKYLQLVNSSNKDSKIGTCADNRNHSDSTDNVKCEDSVSFDDSMNYNVSNNRQSQVELDRKHSFSDEVIGGSHMDNNESIEDPDLHKKFQIYLINDKKEERISKIDRNLELISGEESPMNMKDLEGF